MSGARSTLPLPAEGESSGGGSQDQIPGVDGEISIGRRAGDPSSSRPRATDFIWPEHFLEAVAVRVAADAAIDGSRLTAAPAVVTIFQASFYDVDEKYFATWIGYRADLGKDSKRHLGEDLCNPSRSSLSVSSAWRAISRSELLWQELTRHVWSPRRHRRFPSWREEFSSLHRTASNFRAGRCLHTHIHTPASSILRCRRLAISDRHLAAGFSDGSVRLYDLPTASLIAQHAFHPHRDRLGQFSAAISGIILLSRRLVFASQDGDITVANVDNFSEVAGRRARAGNLVEDGTLVDFAGDGRWWVGLFAGVPGWSWRVWDGESEEEVYAGGSLTDADSVAGWHMLADISFPSVARIGVAAEGTVVGCSGSWVQVMRVGGMVEVTAEVELQSGATADSLSASDGRVVVVEGGWVAVVREARTLAEVSRFGVAGRRRRREETRGRSTVVGSMNWGYVVMWVGGVGRVWDALTGESLYALRRGTGEIRAAISSDRYLAGWAEDSGLHLWDFGAQLV